MCMLIETAAELHDANMELLQKFDRFCNDNGIRYFITFGTLLGAVRHGDMIPWDDDIDVTMLRSEYYKLIKISKQKYPEGCELVTPGDEETFCGFTPMFKDNTKVGRMLKGSDMDDGSGTGRLGIDIFVLDPSYTGPRHVYLTYRQYMLYAEARAHRAVPKPLDTSRPRVFAVPIVGFFQFIGKRRRLYRIVEDYWKLSLDLKSKGKVLYSPCNIPDELKQEYDAEWFKDTVYLKLDGVEYPAPAGYKALLKRFYGDYMQLPPENKRKPDHFLLKEFQD